MRFQIDLECQFIPFSIAIQVIGLGGEFDGLDGVGVLVERGGFAGGDNYRASREIGAMARKALTGITTFSEGRSRALGLVTASLITLIRGAPAIEPATRSIRKQLTVNEFAIRSHDLQGIAFLRKFILGRWGQVCEAQERSCGVRPVLGECWGLGRAVMRRAGGGRPE